MKNKTRNCIFLALAITFMFLTPTTMVLAETSIEKSSNDKMLLFSYPNENEMIIDFNLQDLNQDQIIVGNDVFTTLDIDKSGFLGTLGRPQLPIISKLIAVPRTDVTLEVISTVSESFEVGKIYPAQAPQTDDSVNSEFVIDDDFYQKDISYPGKIAEIVYDGKIRDISFVKIEIYPVNYNPKLGLATINNDIKIKLSWDSQVVEVESDFENAPFYNYYQNTFSNWQGFLQNTQISEIPKSSGKDPGADYIVVTHNDFYAEAETFADWKHKKGFKTEFVRFSDIGTTANDLQSYIQNAYDSWNPRPSFVCIVGDAEHIPTNYEYSAGSDLWYVTVSGSDYYPDMMIGRISPDTAAEADIMVQKILNYEQNPPSTASFYENFVVAAYFQDDENNGYETRRFVRTSEEVRDYLQSIDYIGERIYVTASYINPTHYNNGYYGNGEPLPPELLRANGFAWDGDADDIINAVNAGVFILNHRDHGSTGGWGDPYFDGGHIAQLTNGELLPVVFSINCLTGQFDNYDCFAEEFVRKENGGAVAAFAATRTSYSGYNDWLCRGFYDARWPDFDTDQGDETILYTLGEMLNYGKTYMANTWGDPWGYERLTFELFHVFGDPSMEIWTDVPSDLTVTYTFTGSGVEVSVSGPSGVIDGARVGLSQESGFYANAITDSTGKVVLDTTGADILEEITLVASAHDYIPFMQTFVLNQAPVNPLKPDGPPVGKTGIEYLFTTSSTDADDDQIWYMWRWGDGGYSDWDGPYNSGQTASASHVFEDTGNFRVRVKAKDSYNQETDWSAEHTIQITKSKSVNMPLLRLLQNFPNIYNLVKIYLGL